jgi:hypothetical protein
LSLGCPTSYYLLYLETQLAAGKAEAESRTARWNRVLLDWPVVKKNNCFIMSARLAKPHLLAARK